MEIPIKYFADEFVGRKDELAKLNKLLKKANAGFGSFIVISGEAGIGKTMLAKKFSQDAKNFGALSVSAQFNSSNKFEPYTPFKEIVEQLETCYAIEHESVATLAKTSGINSQIENDIPWDMNKLFSIQNKQGVTQQQLLASILRAARNKLIMINLKDAHQAPLTAWRFIHYICESIIEHKILFIVTLRQDGQKHSQTEISKYSDVLQRMNREGLYENLVLDRFEERDIRELVRKRFHRSDFSSRFIPNLTEISDGIPGQAVRCIELMLEEGIIFQQNDVWFNHETISKKELLKLISDEERINAAENIVKGLTSDQRELLQYAAFLDGQLNVQLLAEILKKPKLKVIKEFIRLKEKKVLTQNEDFYLFKQSAIQTYLVDITPPDTVVSIHKSIASTVKNAGYMPSVTKTYLLAYHYSRTDDTKTAFRYLVQAGLTAIENYAFLEANDFFNQAIQKIETTQQEKNKKKIIQLLVRVAWLKRILGFWDESINHCQKALDLCEDTDEKLRTEILIQQGLSYFRKNELKEALECFHQSMIYLEELNPLDQALIYYGLGNVHFEYADYNLSEQEFEKAYTLAEQSDAEQLMANIINNLSVIKNVRGNYLGAIAKYSQCIPLYQKLGDKLGLAQIYHNIGMTHAEEGNWKIANEFYGKSLTESDSNGFIPLKSITFLNRALALAHLQKIDDAIEYNYKAYRQLKRLNDELGMAEYHKVQGVIERIHNKPEESLKQFKLAKKKYLATNNKLGNAETEYELAHLSLTTGNKKEAERWLKKSIDKYHEMGLKRNVKKIENELKQIKIV